MSTYTILSTTRVKFGKYDDVLRVMAKRKRGFWASLFSSNDMLFIISEGSPLAKQIQDRTSMGTLMDIDESMFKSTVINGKTYLVESKIDSYESAKQRIEIERKERELKAKKEREEKEAAARICKDTEKQRRIDETLNNATIHKMPFSNLQRVFDVNDSFSDQMATIAGNANMSFLCKDDSGFQKYIIELYNMVHGYNSHKLKTIAAKDGQCIGLAFIKLALYYSNGDFQLNEIAAQNAYYSIIKNYSEAGNKTALPALFTLLLKKPQTLEDELYRANPNPQLAGWGKMLPAATYIRHERAMANRLLVMRYLLSTFYDDRQNKFIINTTIPYHIPSEGDVTQFLNEYNKSDFTSRTGSISKGKEYLYNIYDDIEEQLNL